MVKQQCAKPQVLSDKNTKYYYKIDFSAMLWTVVFTIIMTNPP